MRKQILFGVFFLFIGIVSGVLVYESFLQKKHERLNAQAVESFAEGAYKKALALEEEALEVLGKMFFPSSLDKALLLSNLGIYYNADGDFAKAIETSWSGLRIREKLLSPYDADRATNHLTIANASETLGLNEDADKHYMQALNIYNNTTNVSDYDFGNLWSHMGGFHKKLGNYTFAEECYTKALAYHEKLPFEDQEILGNSLRGYGTLLIEEERYEEALEVFERALGVDLRFLDPSHPDIGTTYNNIGAAHYQLGDQEKASQYYEKALDIRIKALGLYHQDVAQTFNNLGMLHREYENYAKAKKYLEDAIRIEEKIYGRRNQETAITISNLGLVYWDTDEFAKAEEIFLETLSIQEEVLASNHPDTLRTLDFLVSLYGDMNEEEKADAMREKRETIYAFIDAAPAAE